MDSSAVVQPEGGQKDAEPPAVDLARTPATEEKRSERVGEAGAGKVWVECGVWEDGKVGADQSLDVVEEECMVPDLALSLIANCAASVISAVSEERLASTHSISSGVSGVKGLEEREEEDGGGCGEEGSSAGEALEVNRDDDEECENSGGWSGGESSAEEENDELLEVKVEGTDGRMSWFKIRQHTKLTKVFNLFCERFKLERDEATFLFDECEIDGFDTPHDLDLQDGGTIKMRILPGADVVLKKRKHDPSDPEEEGSTESEAKRRAGQGIFRGALSRIRHAWNSVGTLFYFNGSA